MPATLGGVSKPQGPELAGPAHIVIGSSDLRKQPAVVRRTTARDIKERFARAVLRRREAMDLSQEELEMGINADRAYVSRIEAGQVNVTLEMVAQIADALGCDAADPLTA